MLGAIAGDVIGSVCEVRPVKTTGFDLFPPRVRLTGDFKASVLVVAFVEYTAAYCWPSN